MEGKVTLQMIEDFIDERLKESDSVQKQYGESLDITLSTITKYLDKIENLEYRFRQHEIRYKFLIDLERNCRDIIFNEMQERFDKAQEFVEENLQSQMRVALRDLLDMEDN